MNQITLYRKGGRNPWVFVWDDGYEVYICRPDKSREYTLEIVSDPSFPIGVCIDRETYVQDAPSKCGRYVHKQIHADHFTLGNVTITF